MRLTSRLFVPSDIVESWKLHFRRATVVASSTINRKRGGLSQAFAIARAGKYFVSSARRVTRIYNVPPPRPLRHCSVINARVVDVCIFSRICFVLRRFLINGQFIERDALTRG